MQSPRPDAAEIARLASEYRDAVVAGDGRGAERVVRALLARGVDLADLYLRVFAPALEVVGVLWQEGALSVADEHLATAITERMMSLVRPYFSAGPQAAAAGGDFAQVQPSLLLACAPGETHRVGAQMVADVFVRAGWEVLFLGSDVPGPDLVRLAAARHPDLIGLSLTTDGNLSATRAVIEQLQSGSSTYGIPVLIGGGLVAENPEMGEALGADISASTPFEALTLANAVLERKGGGEAGAVERQQGPTRPMEVPAFITEAYSGKPLRRRGGTESADAGFAFVLDDVGRVLWADDTAIRLFGNVEAALCGRHFSALTDNFSREKVMTLLSRTRSEGVVHDFEVNHMTGGNRPSILLAAYSASLLPDGTVALLGRDRTRLMDAAERMAAANQQLEGKISDLAAEVARLKTQQARLSGNV